MKLKTKAEECLKDLSKLSLMIKWCNENFEEPQELEMCIAYAAEIIKHELKDFSTKSLKALNSALNKSGIISQEIMQENVLEFNDVGIVSLVRSFVRFSYDGTYIDKFPTIVLKINGVEYTSKALSEEQIEKFKENLLVLFDKEAFSISRPIDKVEALYEIFKSPRLNNYLNGYNTMVDAIRSMASHRRAIANGTVQEHKQKSYNKVISLYLEYLWECDNQGKEIKYIYSFESWINKNKHLWGEDISTPQESLNLFVEEHKEIIKMFDQIEEPGMLWQGKNEKLSSRGLLLEIIISGLGGL